MIYSVTPSPKSNSIYHAINKDKHGNPRGVNVFIHEMAVAPEIWAMKMKGLTQPGDPNDPVWAATLAAATAVQNSSHTPQGAFGYLLSQIDPRPRLTVATHFPTADDTVDCALKSVTAKCPDIIQEGDQLVWSFDLMVLRVFPDRIEQRRAVVNDFSFSPPVPRSEINNWVTMYAPKYHTNTGATAPEAQLDLTYEINSTQDGGYNGQPTFCDDGY